MSTRPLSFPFQLQHMQFLVRAPELQMIGPLLGFEHGNDTHCEAEPVYAMQALRASDEVYIPMGVQS